MIKLIEIMRLYIILKYLNLYMIKVQKDFKIKNCERKESLDEYCFLEAVLGRGRAAVP